MTLSFFQYMSHPQAAVASSESTDTWYSPDHLRELIRRYGLPTPDYIIVEAKQDILEMNLSFPVALKVCSASILHKTEVGGVTLGITDRAMLIREYEKMKER